MVFEIPVHTGSVLLESLLRDVSEPPHLSLLVIFPAICCRATVVLIILSKPQSKEGILCSQQLAFTGQLLYLPLEVLIDQGQLLVFFNSIIECVLQQLVVQLFLFQQTNEIKIRIMALPFACWLFLMTCCLLAAYVAELNVILFFKALEQLSSSLKTSHKYRTKLIEGKIVLPHGFVVPLVLIPLFYEVSNKLLGMAFVHFLLESMQLVLNGGFSQVLIPTQACHH